MPESIYIETPIVDKETIIEGLKRNSYFLNNWLPGYYEKNPVKTKNNIYLRFDD